MSLVLAGSSFGQAIFQGPTTGSTPYVLPLLPGSEIYSVFTVDNTGLAADDSVPNLVGGAPYGMAGIPDGLGAFDNNDGTFTLLCNQELGNTVGVTRAHGNKGAFVSKWNISKNNLAVNGGTDLMTSVIGWNTGTQSSGAVFAPAFNRFCSADLPEVSAFYNSATGLGTQERIFMHGEEGGATGWQQGTVVTGPNAGKSYHSTWKAAADCSQRTGQSTDTVLQDSASANLRVGAMFGFAKPNPIMTTSAPTFISVREFGALLSKETPPCVLDVRTPAEFAECHVQGAKLAPLDVLDPKKAAEALKPAPGSPIYLLCKSGGRATKAAEQFIAAGIPNVSVVTGGTDACAAAGLSVTRGGKAGIPLDGQIRIAIGSLVLLFWLLARAVHYAFGYLIPAMSVALIVSGLTGFCGMAILLGKAPWNQNRDADSCRVC